MMYLGKIKTSYNVQLPNQQIVYLGSGDAHFRQRGSAQIGRGRIYPSGRAYIHRYIWGDDGHVESYEWQLIQPSRVLGLLERGRPYNR